FGTPSGVDGRGTTVPEREESTLEAWTRRVIRHRKLVLVLWLVLFAFGIYGVTHIGSLLSNRFSVPGSDAENGLNLVKDRLHERGEGASPLTGHRHGRTAARPPFLRRLEAAARRGATVLKDGEAGVPQVADPHLAYVQINTSLENADASDKTTAVRAAIPSIPGETTYVSGFPAINHDTQQLNNQALDNWEPIARPTARIGLAA